MKFSIFDIETDGLLDEVTKIHCLSYSVYEDGLLLYSGSIVNYEDIKSFITSQEYLVGHNIIRYDLPVLAKILDIKEFPKTIDTLALSWYLKPYRKVHGLESYGEELGVPKPKIEDWVNLSIKDYLHRCETDVQINSLLFLKQFQNLFKIYDNLDEILYFCSYLTFKLQCLVDQEEVGIPLNVDKCIESLNILEEEFNQKTKILSEAMPPELGNVIKKRPKLIFKKDGSLSSKGLSWINYLEENNLPADIDCVRDKPNPGSDTQLKTWLFQLGWKPITFKESKATGDKIPQVSLPFGQGICSSVKELYDVQHELEELEGYFRIKHRIGVFNSYLDNMKDGKVFAGANGLTKTLRLAHSKPFVNLPKPGVFYGKEVREVLTIPNDNYIMIGSDVSGLEDNTKQHYIYYHDPEYVDQMRVPGFDPHVDIGVLAGLISKEEAEFLNWASKNKDSLTEEDITRVKDISKRRGIAKSANFAATYGAGGPKIAETAKISEADGHKLHKIYWERNWAIKKIAEECLVKTVSGQKWLYNPLSGFWLYLSSEKDRFSALNQNKNTSVLNKFA